MVCHQTIRIRRISHALIFVAAVLTAAGCSTGNNQQIFDPDTGKHPANWVSNHGVTFLSDPGLCFECHGTDLRGGISGVSCYSATFNGIACHANGPGGHPSGWDAPGSHGVSAKYVPDAAAMHGFSTCQICHGTYFAGGYVTTACSSCHGVSAPHPASWITGSYTHTNTDDGNASVCVLCHANGANSPIPAPSSPPAGTAPGCINGTLCHAAAGHSAGWATPTVHGPAAKSAPNAPAMLGFSTCQPCHGNTFGGNATHPACSSCHGGSAPHPTSWITGSYTHTNTNTGNAAVCSLCHSAGANSPTAPPSPPAPAGTPPGCFNATLCHAQKTCGSCHGIPPDGTTAPNVAGRHAEHMALNPGIITCSTCHNGAGAGTGLHPNGAVNVIFEPGYNARSGAASFNAGSNTCTNVSCHGGQTSPVWLNGTITVNTQCTSCHAYGTTQYNSFNSGQHNKHVNGEGFACTECHDTTKLAAIHFNDLNTTAMNQAALTLQNSLNYTGTAGGTATGNCTINCHNENHSNRPW